MGKVSRDAPCCPAVFIKYCLLDSIIMKLANLIPETIH